MGRRVAPVTSRRIVIVGAGGSGIPLAARLGAQGDHVVLVEAGTVHMPDAAWTVRAAMPGLPSTWTYDAELMPGRLWRIARGRMPGGSTAVNGAVFQRPHPDDFASWAATAGAPWSYEACLPALRRLESDRDFPDAPVHGHSGPVPVQRTGADDPLTRAFLAAAVAAGAVREADKNGGGSSGVGLVPRNALGADRWSVDRAYAPLLAAASVEVRSGAIAQRIRFQGRRAVGVDVVVDGIHEFVAADEVVLCAGAIETPRLLLRSGVGDAAACDPAAAHVAARRGVGRNLSDHAAIDVSWRLRGARRALGAAWTAAWNAPAGTVAGLGVEMLLAVLPTAAILTGDATATGALDLRVTLAEPLSRGAVTLGPAPMVRYGYLSHDIERAALRAAVRAADGILRSSEMGDLVAWVAPEPGPLGTALHSCGTARMGAAEDPDAVADAHGRVHDTENLRIADASLLPHVPSRGTALAAVLIGERIAELMAAE
jgi:choline dehydrogenase-like flavoprotein